MATARFNVRDLTPEWVELGIPKCILKLIENEEGDIEQDDYDGELNFDENEPNYYDVEFRFEGYTITLYAVSNYHLTEVK